METSVQKNENTPLKFDVILYFKWRFCVALWSVWKLQSEWPKEHVVNNTTCVVLLTDFDV